MQRRCFFHRPRVVMSWTFHLSVDRVKLLILGEVRQQRLVWRRYGFRESVGFLYASFTKRILRLLRRTLPACQTGTSAKFHQLNE
jgi:hypothetical protein